MKLPPPDRGSAFDRLLDKINAGTATEDDYKASNDEIEAHNARHAERMAREFGNHERSEGPPPEAIKKLGEQIAQAVTGVLQASFAANSSVVEAVRGLTEALNAEEVREGIAHLPTGDVRMTMSKRRRFPVQPRSEAPPAGSAAPARRGRRGH